MNHVYVDGSGEASSLFFRRFKERAPDPPARDSNWLDWGLETVVYVVIAVSLLSRGHTPELAHKPLTLALIHVTVVPAFLMRGRGAATTLSRIALAMMLGMLVHSRLPIDVPGMAWTSPMGERLSLSLTGLITVFVAAAVAYLWVRAPEREDDRRRVARTVAFTTCALFVFAGVIWVLVNGVMRATTEPDGRFYADTMGALSIAAQYATLTAYTLTTPPLGRIRRLGVIAGIALSVGHYLPPTGGV